MEIVGTILKSRNEKNEKLNKSYKKVFLNPLRVRLNESVKPKSKRIHYSSLKTTEKRINKRTLWKKNVMKELIAMYNTRNTATGNGM